MASTGTYAGIDLPILRRCGIEAGRLALCGGESWSDAPGQAESRLPRNSTTHRAGGRRSATVRWGFPCRRHDSLQRHRPGGVEGRRCSISWQRAHGATVRRRAEVGDAPASRASQAWIHGRAWRSSWWSDGLRSTSHVEVQHVQNNC